jgi:hypothetical protein
MAGDALTFASVEDLSHRTGKDYEGSDATRASTLLSDASYVLVGLGLDADEQDYTRLMLAKIAVCNAVAHKLSKDAAYEAASQLTESAGPYSRTMSFATPSGSLTFLRQDLTALGVGTQGARSIQAGSADLGGGGDVAALG